MRRNFPLTIIVLFCGFCLKAQENPIKQYIIDINNQINYNPKAAKLYLARIAVADSVFPSSTVSHRYLIYTKKELNQNIIEGKLQKNAIPMSNFQYIGESPKDLLK